MNYISYSAISRRCQRSSNITSIPSDILVGDHGRVSGSLAHLCSETYVLGTSSPSVNVRLHGRGLQYWGETFDLRRVVVIVSVMRADTAMSEIDRILPHASMHHKHVTRNHLTTNTGHRSSLLAEDCLYSASIYPLVLSIIGASNNNIINLENHTAELRRKHQLLSLGDQRVDNEVVAHVVAARLHAVNTQTRIALFQLSRFDLGQCLDRRQTAVVGECLRHGVEGVGESPHRVLLESGRFHGRVFDRETAGDFGRAAAVDDAVVADEVADDAEGVVKRALGFVDDLGRELALRYCITMW